MKRMSQPPTNSALTGEDPSREPDAPQPLVNAPWPVVTLSVGIVGLYLLQTMFPQAVALYAFSPAALAGGQWGGLITSQFLHGGWAHVLMNGAFILAFGAPVARFLGQAPRGLVAFFGFYLMCGVFAALGFAALNWGLDAAMVGASGAASGLMGAAARLIGGGGRPGAISSPAVTGMAGAWVVVNVIMAFTGGALMPGAGDAAVAWEAHLAGFAAGVVLLPLAGMLAGRR